jgi:lipopolysaccharide biosynthesis regulator YciM
MRTLRWVVLGGISLALAALSWGGYALYEKHMHGIDSLLRKGETSYAEGLRSFDSRDYDAASRSFDEARLQAKNALDACDKASAGIDDKPQEEVDALREQTGRASLLKARALRGLGLSRMVIAGKSLPPPADPTADGTSTSLSQISYWSISDSDLKRQAVAALREAARWLTDDVELQREALAMEVSRGEPPYWPAVKVAAGHIIQKENSLDPTQKIEPDARAHFMMARLEFEQPTPSGNEKENWKSTPIAKRSKDRVLRARQHIEDLKKVEKPLRWRSLYLEAQTRLWMIDYYRTGQQPSSTDRLQEELALRVLLFDEDHGILRRALQDKDTKLTRLTRLDLDGMLELHKLAMEKVISSRKQGQEPDTVTSGQVLKVIDATAELCKRLAGQEGADPKQLEELAETMVNAATIAQPFLAKDYAVEWARYIDSAQALTQRVAERNAGWGEEKQNWPRHLYEKLVELLQREARYRALTGDSSRQEELRALAIKWADEGIRVAAAYKPPVSNNRTLPLHDVAARLKTAALGKKDAVEPHLKVLAESGNPTYQATKFLIEGSFAEREGRLEKARDAFEQALKLTTGGNNARRAHLVLGHVYLALGQPEKALASLKEVQALMSQPTKLTDEERVWAKEYLKDPAEISYMIMQARLMDARMTYQAALKQELTQPQAKAIREAIMAEEEEAEKLLPSLGKSPFARAARHLLVSYYTATDRPTMAKAELDNLRKEYPGSLQVLKQEVELLAKPIKGTLAQAPKASIDQADKRIQEFITAHPSNDAARLYWVQWLATTNRMAQAAAYLEDSANFTAAANNPQLKQVLAVLQLNLGGQDRVKQIAADLPAGQIADRIAVLASSVDGQEKLADALSRYENNGFFRCYNASLAFSKGDYVAAARGYSQALEYTQVKDTARMGLGNSLLALAQTEPQKARELAGLLLRDYPREPHVLLAFAYACMLLDDLGDPQKPTSQIEDMISALNAMEQIAIQEGETGPAGALVKAQFWLGAGRPDRARGEVLRALAKSPKHEGALLLAARLYLESQEPGAQVTGQKFLDTLRTVSPNSLQAGLLQARYHEAAGRTAEAVRTYEAVIEQHPTASAAYSGLVALLEKQGEMAKATQIVAQWCGKVPEDLNSAAAHVRQLALAGKLADAEQAATQGVEMQLRVANDRLASSRGTAAEQQEQRQRTLDGARMAAQLGMAGAFTQAKAYDLAIAWVDRVLKVQPDSIPASLLVGNIYMDRVRTEQAPAQRKALAQKAHDAYARVYTLQRGHAVAGNNIAWLLATELNDADKALVIAREVRTHQLSKRLRAGDELPVELLDTFGAITKNLTKPDVYPEMTDLFEKALKRYSSDPRLYLHLGRAYAGQKNKTKANEYFANAITVSKTKSTLPAAERQTIIQEAEQEQKKLGVLGGPVKPPVDF